MALRTSKITSELVQNCNKFFSHNSDATLRCKLPSVIGRHKNNQAFRYKITDTAKSKGAPEIVFQEEPTTLFAELQPSANPELKYANATPKWAEKYTDNSPFPSQIRSSRSIQNYTDQHKAEEKMMKYKMGNFNPTSRHFSTGSARWYSSRPPAENSGKGNCKQKLKRCKVPVRHRDCRINKDCPRIKLMNCEQSKGSNCKLNYLDPNCTKKFAPYPSYSETCAENLPDDPSECQQCPWRICDGSDRIEPGKPVRHKRSYSTSCSTHLNATAGIVVGPLLPPPLVDVEKFICGGKCGQTKKPCKQPPGPCEVRKQKEDEKRRDKEIHIPPRPKKASEDVNRMVLNGATATEGQLLWSDNFTSLNTEGPFVENKSSWIDIIEGEELFLTKKGKHPNCHRKKKPKRPKDSEVDVTRFNGNGMLLSKDKKIKGDEGHPPPCEHDQANSLKCPQKPIKKPKYKKRPMDRGYYKNPDDPYNPSNGK